MGFELQHPNLLKTLGIAEDPQHGMMMVLEYADGGSLHDKLIGPAIAPDMQQVLAWLSEVAEGMRVLHNQTTPTIHCDLKPANILLKHDKANQLVAVISDFGLAKVRWGFVCLCFGVRAFFWLARVKMCWVAVLFFR